MAKGRVEIIADLCKACGYCVKFCPKNVLDYGQKVNSFGYAYVTSVNEDCIACCSCARMCPAGAINVYKEV